jgi:hypothetical protein
MLKTHTIVTRLEFGHVHLVLEPYKRRMTPNTWTRGLNTQLRESSKIHFKSATRTPVMILFYRYLSGIYHFFDSFGKCGKKGGIGMVLVF